MSRFIGLAFSQTNPRNYPSLAPTFLAFKNALDGSDISKPTITQLGTEGIYGFTYTAAVPTYFLCDGITTSTASDRYVYGLIDPVQQVDEQLTQLSTTLSARHSSLLALGTTGVALGTTAVALGTSGIALGTTAVALGITGVAIGTTIYGLVSYNASLITDISARVGTTASAFGSTSVDPGDLFGFLKRAQEFREGDQSFDKTTGVWSISTRGSTLLTTKTLTNSSTTVNKT